MAASNGSANWQPELYSSAHFTVAETRPTNGRVNQMTEPTFSAEYVLSWAPLTEISETRHSVRRNPLSSASKSIADLAAPRLPVFAASKSALNITLVRPASLTFLYHKAKLNISAAEPSLQKAASGLERHLAVSPRVHFSRCRDQCPRLGSRPLRSTRYRALPRSCCRCALACLPRVGCLGRQPVRQRRLLAHRRDAEGAVRPHGSRCRTRRPSSLCLDQNRLRQGLRSSIVLVHWR